MLARKAKQRLETSSTIKLLTMAAMVDNLAEKGRRVSTKSRSLSIVCVQSGPRKLSIIRSSRVSAIQRLLTVSIEVNGRTVGTFKIVRYIMGVCCILYIASCFYLMHTRGDVS